MFNQSEKKLKIWATIQGMFFSVVAIVLGAVIYSTAAATDNNAVGLLLGVIVAVVVWFLSMLSVWTLYSFADLVEYTKAKMKFWLQWTRHWVRLQIVCPLVKIMKMRSNCRK